MLRPLTRSGLLFTFRKAQNSNSIAILISFVICCSLLFSSLVLAQPAPQRPQALARQGHPEPGPPEGSLPNLDQARRHRQVDPEAPVPVPSAMRGRRKPREPRNGRKVGDPGTTSGGVGALNTSDSDHFYYIDKEEGFGIGVQNLQDGRDEIVTEYIYGPALKDSPLKCKKSVDK